MPVMESLMRHQELWNEDTCRTTFEGTPHGEVEDVLLRFGAPDGNGLEAVDRPAMKLLANAKPLCLSVMSMVSGSRLGRVVITRLAPGHKILLHKDTVGDYASYYSRYHLVLQGLPGSIFIAGDDEVNMQTGELWWFQAQAEHAVFNNSQSDRIHMLIDVRIDP